MDQESLSRMTSQNYRAGSEGTKAILLFVTLICILQIGVIWLPEGVIYRTSEYFSTDVVLMLLSLVAYRKTPHRDINEKACWFGVLIWHQGCWIYNILVQLFFIDTPVAVMSSTAMVFILIIVFAFRYIFRWHAMPVYVETGNFYEVIGKPTNLSQLVVAMYSGRGGAFGITDGVHLWHYSKSDDEMVCETLDPKYTAGRMVERICDTSEDKYNVLNIMSGQRFTLMHNCLEIHALSGKWR